MNITPRNLIKEKTKNIKREFVIRSLPYGNIAILGGSGGVGKCFFILSMLDEKENFLNQDPNTPLTPKRIAFLNFEDDILTIKSRLGDSSTYHDWDFIDCIGESIFTEIKKEGVFTRILNKDIFDNLKEYDLIIIDTWGLSSGIDENDNSATSKAMRVLKLWLKENKSSLMIVHHTSKAGMRAEEVTGTHQIRGASSLTDNARLVVLIYPKIIKVGKEKKFSKSIVVADIVKANYTIKDSQEFKRGDRGELGILGAEKSGEDRDSFF